MNFKKSISIFSILFVHSLSAQTWDFSVKPILESFHGTFQTKILEHVHDNNFFETKNSKLGNIIWGGPSIGLDLTFLKMKKLKFGLSIYNNSACNATGVFYYPTSNFYPISDSLLSIHTMVASKSKNFGYLWNYGINVGYEVDKKNSFLIYLNYQQSSTNKEADLISTWGARALHDGYFYSIDTIFLKDMPTKSFSAKMTFERQFFSKKQKNLFAIRFSYQQGFQTLDRTKTHAEQFPLGYKLVMESVSKSSGFFIGISKNISFHKKSP
jgi:hypothetical protein